MKPLYTLLTTTILAVLFVALIYYTQELWRNLALTSPLVDHLAVAIIIFTKYCLVSGFVVCLVACKKRHCGMRHKYGLIHCLISGLIVGLLAGLLIGLTIAHLQGSFIGLIWGPIGGLVFGLSVGLLAGLANEFE